MAAPDPKNISISDYTYDLPDERIAKYPLPNRDDSKLLIYNNGNITTNIFKNIADELPAGALLVFNNSKVVEARLLFQKATGGVIEIFTLEPHEMYADITTAMKETGSILYKCLVGGAGKWKRGMVLTKDVQFNNATIHISAAIKDRRPDSFIIELSWTPSHFSFAEILHAAGNIPIPPYLHRDADKRDTERYQTIYAKADGSVAAPTAGLHFTPAVLHSLEEKKIKQAFVTLHVGAGTFMPVKSATMLEHNMHAEFIEVSIGLVKQLAIEEMIVPVGTTSMRTLESLYWMGLKAYLDPSVSIEDIVIQQWDVYNMAEGNTISKLDSLHALVNWMENCNLEKLIVKTQVLIAPGYQFKMANALVTNFHQPQSTLLLLVSAFIGNEWKRVYNYAMDHEFRFLSYGDSCLLFPS